MRFAGFFGILLVSPPERRIGPLETQTKTGMKTWMKVAIGCVAASVIGFFLVLAGLVGLGYWAKNRIEQATNGGAEAEEARRSANAVPFATPSGSIIDETRLVKFIEVRASVYSVHEKYRGEIETRAEKVRKGDPIDFSDLSTGLTFVNEIQKAEALALAKYEMSEAEYGFISGEVYKALWTEIGGDASGRRVLEGTADATKAAAPAMEKQTQGLPPEAQAALDQARKEIEQGSAQVTQQLQELKTAPENAALFARYEKDLKKYAMPALQMIFDENSRLKIQAPTPGS